MDTLRYPQGKLTFVAGWFGLAYTSLLFSILMLLYLSTVKVVQPSYQNFKLYTSLPQATVQISDQVIASDARSKIVENFFKDYGSILASYADLFIEVADKYRLDFRLLPAIAMQESLGGKKVIGNSHNPFGYGIYGNLIIKFSSWEEGIEKVAKALREDYLNLGLTTPQKIMTKYTPPSAAKGGTWAKAVTSFMKKLQ